METQRLLKPKEKTIIVSDFREKEIIKNLERLGAKVIKQSLEVGDVICSENVCIERKSYDDFVSSVIDGRIFEQAKLMKENFKKSVIIVEGYSIRDINENALKGAIASLLIDFDISILSTKNPMDTAKTIYWIAKKEQKEGMGVAIKVGKKPKSEKEMQEFIIGSIPGVSTVLARRLLNKFGSAERVFQADEDNLQTVEGIGKKLAKKIRDVLTAKY